MPLTGELTGWKEIATHLDVSVRTAQGYEKNLGLPVRRQPGEKRRIFATPADLDAWKQNLEIQSPPSAAVARELPTTNRLTRSRRWLPLAASLAAVGILASLMWPRDQSSNFHLEANTLIVAGSKGQELWRHVFPWDLQETAYADQNRARHFWLGSLDGKGQAQLLFNAVPHKVVEFGTPVFCFGPKGKIVWQFVPGRSVVDGRDNKMTPPYPSNTLLVVRGKTNAETRVVISSNHYLGQANQVAFLASDGQVVGEYWHPGHLLHLGQVDLDGNGREKLLLAGVNNGDHQATLVVLDPLKISGLVTPQDMEDHRFELLHMGSAKEEAVVLFPRSCISAGKPYTRVSALHVNKDRIIAAVSEGIAEPDQGFVYEFDYKLRVVGVVPTNVVEVERIHRDLEAQGKLDHSFNSEKECNRLKAGVIVQR